MVRFLIVDDAAETVKALTMLIRLEFQGAEIDAAENVSDAERLIIASGDTGNPYDVAILDFLLPKDASSSTPAYNDSVCTLIRKTMPSTLVVHATGYPEQPEIKEHCKTLHNREYRGDPPTKVIDKGADEWTGQLISYIRGFLYNYRVYRGIRELFGNRTDIYASSHALRLQPSSSHITHALSALIFEIQDHWQDLDSVTRKDVEEHFIVSQETGRAHVKLK